MKKFIIATNGVTKEQRDGITSYLNAQGWQVWHWFEDLWLVAEASEELESSHLAKALREGPMQGSGQVLVIRPEGDMQHWGWANPQSWSWMRENWGRAAPDPD